jgi:hypothetical protein
MYTKGSTKKLSVEIAARESVDTGVNIMLSPSYGGVVMGLYKDSLLSLYSSSSNVLAIDSLVI